VLKYDSYWERCVELAEVCCASLTAAPLTTTASGEKRPCNLCPESLDGFQSSHSCPSADGHPETMKLREAPWSAAA